MQSRTGALLKTGQIIVSSLGLVESTLAKQACAAFIDAQNALGAANQQVRLADRVVREATDVLITADKVKDSATFALAARLVAEGGDRIRPFKQFGVSSVSKLVRRGYVRQAMVLNRLAHRVLSGGTASPETKAAAETMEQAVMAVIAANAQRNNALVKRTEAIAARDASLPDVWRQALSHLRLSIRFADAKEGTSDYEAVFPVIKRRRKSVVTPSL